MMDMFSHFKSFSSCRWTIDSESLFFVLSKDVIDIKVLFTLFVNYIALFIILHI